MRIGLYFNKPGVLREHKEAVSAHIQLPAYTYSLLKEKGIPSVVITTRPASNQVLPKILETIADTDISILTDPNRQKEQVIVEVGQKKGVDTRQMLKHIFELISQVKGRKLDKLVVFGTQRFSLVAIFVKLFCPTLKLVKICEFIDPGFPKYLSYIESLFYGEIFASTKYVQQQINSFKEVKYLPRGVYRQFDMQSEQKKHRVLFWRDPSFENGADLAMQSFIQLAPQFPDITFTLAVRPHWDPVISSSDLVFDNIEIIEFPYPQGVTLDLLLSESICVLFPFRSLSVNPQLALIETLMAGVQVLSSSVESCREIMLEADQYTSDTNDPADYSEKLSKILDYWSMHKKQMYPLNTVKLQNEYNWSAYLYGIAHED